MLRPLLIAALLATPAAASTLRTSAGEVGIAQVLGGLEEPWGFAFLPDGGVLVTERDRVRLTLLKGGAAHPVAGLPQVRTGGQGGLLDVMVPRDFATSREVWLSYAVSARRGAATAVGRGRLSPDGTRLDGFETLWTGDAVPGGRHFGARLVEGGDGTIYIGTGDRGTGPEGRQAQDPTGTLGKVIALARDGTPRPAPEGRAPGVHSLGHRNIQGAALDGQGRLWVVEHGARGGDEINLVEAGRNYGWPVIAYGVNYGGTRIGIGTEAPGMEQPAHYWDPSIAPSGLAIYDGALFPGWRGHMLVGSLKFDHIARLDPAKGFAGERISAPETGRVRDVRVAPDGSVWFLSVTRGALYRMAPAQ